MEDDKPVRPWNKQLTFHWTIVFLLNMPLPWLLGVSIAGRPWGQWGMACGCLCVYTIGFYFAGHGTVVARRIIWGGWVVAGAQCVIIPHMIVGIIAEGVWGKFAVALKMTGGDFTFAKGYALTLLVGQMLIAVAFVIGKLLHFSIVTVRDELDEGKENEKSRW